MTIEETVLAATGTKSARIFSESLNSGTRWRVMTGSSVVGHFYQDQYPYCCGSAMMWDLQVGRTYRGKGVGKALLELSERVAWIKSYTQLTGIEAQMNGMVKTFESRKWTKIDEFVNRNGGNTCTMWSKNLRKGRQQSISSCLAAIGSANFLGTTLGYYL